MSSSEELKPKPKGGGRQSVFDTPTGRVIDAMLVSESVVTKARQRLKDEHSIEMSVKWLRMRKNKLIKRRGREVEST